VNLLCRFLWTAKKLPKVIHEYPENNSAMSKMKRKGDAPCNGAEQNLRSRLRPPKRSEGGEAPGASPMVSKTFQRRNQSQQNRTSKPLLKKEKTLH
jgi:hypothetical protein